MAEPCISCPFRNDNDQEFGVIVARLLSVMLKPTKRATRTQIARSRAMVRMERLLLGPDFGCHCTIYNPDMSLKPEREWKQCKGASDAYRAERAKK